MSLLSSAKLRSVQAYNSKVNVLKISISHDLLKTSWGIVGPCPVNLNQKQMEMNTTNLPSLLNISSILSGEHKMHKKKEYENPNGVPLKWYPKVQ